MHELDTEFWQDLQCCINERIGSFSDNHLRFLYVDGFVPAKSAELQYGESIQGKAFVSEDDGTSFVDYDFSVELVDSLPDFSSAPASDDWLTINRRNRTITIRFA